MRRVLRFLVAALLLPGALLYASGVWGEEPAGVGLQVVGLASGNLVVIQVVAGSPAEQAGIRPGDLVVAVGGKKLAGTKLATLSRETLWGPPGAALSIDYLRPGVAGEFEVVLTRARLSEVPNAPAGVRMLNPQQLQEKEGRP